MLTKSKFISYLRCPEEAWLDYNSTKQHRTLDPLTQLSFDQGNLVDKLAQAYFSQAPLQALFGAAGEITFQDNFLIEQNYLVRSDAVFRPSAGSPVTVVEVKASRAKFDKHGALRIKQDHLLDLAFQRFVMRRKGLSVDACGLLLLNSSYKHDGENIALDELFSYHDVTTNVEAVQAQVDVLAVQALAFLKAPEPPAWNFTACSNKGDCRWMHRVVTLPNENIFSISGMTTKTLGELLEQRVLAVDDIPDDYKASAGLQRKIAIAKQRIQHCNQVEVDRMLEQVDYPLYFLDYETLSLAVPNVQGMVPYQRLTFQYSLHIQTAPAEGLQHKEFLLEEQSHGALPLVEQLCRDLPKEGGTVIVWNKSFECSLNTEMGKLYPQYADHLEQINRRVFDLMLVFKSPHVEDWRTRGSASIKAVLPALVPELERGYKDLDIGEGGLASYTWYQLASGLIKDEAIAQTREDLLAYCKLDTLAMVKLLEWAQKDTAETHPCVVF